MKKRALATHSGRPQETFGGPRFVASEAGAREPDSAGARSRAAKEARGAMSDSGVDDRRALPSRSRAARIARQLGTRQKAVPGE